ncbi:MAG TPA: copper resistance protein CopC [Acidimicrobiia bacterium]|nr:copper resistance protein CopC [Acidimicrobiia bacterium]
MPYRTARRLRNLTLVLLALGIWAAPAAQAHSDLISTEPAYGASLAAKPDPVLLRFDEPVELRAAITELYVDGRRVSSPKPAHASSDRRTVSVVPTVSVPGHFLLRWFFFGYDGHLMAGELKFTVDPDAASAPDVTWTPAPSRAALPPNAAGPTSNRFSQSAGPVPVTSAAPTTATEAFDAAGDLPAGFISPRAAAAASSIADGGAGLEPAFRPGQTAGLETAARLVGYVSLAVLVGGTVLLVGLWPEGATEERARGLLWVGLAGALCSTLLTLGLKGAGLKGLTAVSAFRPDVISVLFGTHFANVLLTRVALLLVAVALLAILARRPERAVRSSAWQVTASVVGAAIVATHCLTGHASAAGTGAVVAALAHVSGAAVWLGGLVMLAVVVVPRARSEERHLVIPGFSALAEKSVALMAVAGVAQFILLEPGWRGLAASGWGQLLFAKLVLVAFVLALGSKARSFTRRHLIRMVADGTASLRPLAATVAAELTLAIGVLTATALLVARNSPS